MIALIVPKGSTRPEWQGHDDLLPGSGIPPFLVTSGTADAKKTVAAKNDNDLIRS
jgi:hypothetical protein